jgi:cell division protein FtsQ
MDDPRDSSEPRKGRFSAQRTPWWRPASTWGRTLLVCGLLVIVSALAYGIHVCTSFFEHDSRFRIAGTGDIQAAGLAEVTRADILPVFGEDIGRNIFFVPLAQRRKQLEQIPWIQQATVMRLLPDQIRVSVVERQPVAFVRHGQQIGLVDANGVLLTMPAGLLSQHHYSFPVLTGIDAGDPLSSRRERVALYLRLMSELDSSSQHLSDQISEIDLTDPEDARILMPEQGTDVLAHFGQDHFLARYQRYKAHIAQWRQQYPKLAAVDLRYEQQVVLEMNQGGTATSPAPALMADAATPVAAKPIPAKRVEHSGAEAASGAKPDPGKPSAAKPNPIKPEPVQFSGAKSSLAKPNPAKVSAAKPAASSPAARKSMVGHAVTVSHPSSKKTAKTASLKKTSATSRGKKHAQAKRLAQKKSKPKPLAKPHVAARAVTGQ